jgi:hypothetical protein
MHKFTRAEEEPEPQPSGSRFGPPRKYTSAGLLDQPSSPAWQSVFQRLVNWMRSFFPRRLEGNN